MERRRARVLAAAGVAASLAIAACADAASPTQQSNPAATRPSADASRPAWQRTMPTVDGSELDLGEFAGRTVLFWFWAPY